MNIDVFWQEFAAGLNIAVPLDFVAGLKFKAGLEYATGLVVYSKCCGDIFYVAEIHVRTLWSKFFWALADTIKIPQ